MGDSTAIGGAAMGSIFALLGWIVCLGRNGLDIDVRGRSYRRWWSVLLPLRSHSGSLDEFDRVLLAKELRRSKHGTYSVFTVRLAGEDKAHLSVTAERTYEAARQCAEDLAKRIRLNFVDSTWGEDRVTPPEHVDESLRERFQREGRPTVDLSHPPAGMRSRIEIFGRYIRLQVPPRGFQRRFLAPIAALLLFDAFAVFALLPFFQHRNFQGAQLTDLGLLLVFGLVFFAMPALVVGPQALQDLRGALDEQGSRSHGRQRECSLVESPAPCDAGRRCHARKKRAPLERGCRFRSTYRRASGRGRRSGGDERCVPGRGTRRGSGATRQFRACFGGATGA